MPDDFSLHQPSGHRAKRAAVAAVRSEPGDKDPAALPFQPLDDPGDLRAVAGEPFQPRDASEDMTFISRSVCLARFS